MGTVFNTIDYIKRNQYVGDHQVFCDLDNLPSHNSEDYVYVLINTVFHNSSPLGVSVDDGVLTGKNLPDCLVHKRPIVHPTLVNPFQDALTTDCLCFLVYKGSKTDEELLDEFRRLKVTVVYETHFFNSLKKTYSLKKGETLRTEDSWDILQKSFGNE